MSSALHEQLSRRERQIMDAIYRVGKATAAQVMDEIPDPPSYSAVRAMLRILVEKGHLSHDKVGARYIYKPTVSQKRAKKSALHHVLATFFEGSVTQAMAALIDLSDDLSPEELERLSSLIENAKQEGR
ncbi:MAG: BlaI/MecI/CopY family transcriptional regulator [Rhodothermales bacterium]